MIINNLPSLINHWHANPVSFVEQVFNASPEPWQCEALEAVAGNPRVAIRSGKGVGKSSLDAWVILWFLATHYPAKAACTANTAGQLYDVLWAECKKWITRMDPLYGQLLQYEINSDHIVLGQNSAMAKTARKENPEALQGLHEDNMLFIVDEASGVCEEVFIAGEGAMSTKGAKTLLTGNPTRTSGYFYNAFHRDKSRWVTMQVRCQDSSRVDEEYIEHMLQTHGERSNEYRVGVLGEFPLSDDDAIIPRWMIEAAVGRDVRDNRDEVWGLDIARSTNGDKTVLAKRKGRILKEVIEWRTDDLMHTCGKVADMYYALPLVERPFSIVVDIVGYGAGVYDRLRELKLPVRGCNVGTVKGVDKKKYVRMRDELWFRAREWFESDQVSIPYNEQLIMEMSGVGYVFTSDMRRTVDDKKKKLGYSPDLADAVCLTFFEQDWRPERKIVKQHGPVYAVSDASYIGG